MFGQYQIEKEIIDPDLPFNTTESERDFGQPGGMYLPSVMTSTQALRALIVFVQFKDDSLDLPAWVNWPLNQKPTSWMGTNIIDPDTSTNSNNYNLTHYYNIMSLRKFKLIGNCYYIKTPNTRQQYLQMGYKRADINKQLLIMLDDSLNYDLYDKWEKDFEYTQSWGMDDYIDMIIMIYRNIEEDTRPFGKLAFQLGFGERTIEQDSTLQYDTTYIKWSGVANLGVNGGECYVEDEQKIIDFESWDGKMSGITVMYGYNGLDLTRNVIVHEIGHHLIGAKQPHISDGGWGMMSQYGGRSQMVNSYERHRLKWATAKQYNYNPTNPIALNDYITTGDALRIKNTNDGPEMFYYLENHQRQIGLDNIDGTNDGKGVYVIGQFSDYESGTKFINAQGRHNWKCYGMATLPASSTEVPVFIRGVSNKYGFFDTESVLDGNVSGLIHAYRDTVNDRNLFVKLFKGDGLDMMKPEYVDVMSLYSNPPVNGVSFQIISENNLLKVKQFVAYGTLLSPPPSRPQNLKIHIVNRNPVLTWDANKEPDVIGKTTKRGKYKIYRGTAWMPNNLMTVPEITYSYIGYVNHPTTTFTDEDYTITGGGNDKVFYKVTAVDTTNLESTKSEFDSVRYDWRIQKQNDLEENLTYELNNNYPNPFNPVTTIKYTVPENAFVELKVYDILGREIKQLVGGYQSSGSYSVVFDGENFSSGIYIYKLKANDYNFTKKMVLLK